MMYNSNGPQPTKVTGEQWGRKVSIELPHSDTDLNELIDVFKGIAMGLGYAESSWDECIAEMADSILDEELNAEYKPWDTPTYNTNEISEDDIDAAFAEHNHLESLDD